MTSIVDHAEPRAGALAQGRRLLRAGIDSRLGDWIATSVVVLSIAAPMLFTDSGFADDFTNYLWLVWAAGHALAAVGHPSYFLQTENLGVFVPWFAFYGGTLYTLVGGLSELLGDAPIVAYVGVTTLGIAGSYCGTMWLGRQFGLSRWLSHVPALVVVTSAYYVTSLYGRGAWPEFMASAAIPPLIASAVHLTRARRWRPWPVAAFAVSAIVFSGSHNITLLLGTSIVAFALVFLWLALGAPRRLPFRRLAMVAGLGLASLLVNAWFLLPDVSYARDVQARLLTSLGTERYSFMTGFLKRVFAFDSPGVLLNPLRSVPTESVAPALFVQAPDWFLAWALIAALLLWRRRYSGALRRARRRDTAARTRADRYDAAPRSLAGHLRQASARRARTGSEDTLLRIWLSFAAIAALLLLIIMFTPIWRVVPFPFSAIQFPYRLSTYILYAIAALVLIGALAMQRSAADGRARGVVRELRVGLAAACAISIGLCLWQEWVPNAVQPHKSYAYREEALVSANIAPNSWYDPGSYNDLQAPIVNTSPSRLLLIEPREIHADRFARWIDVPPGLAPFRTDISGGAYLVHISGLRRVGRTIGGFAVLQRRKNGGGRVHVVIEVTHSATLALGWALSAFGSLAVLATLVWTALRGRLWRGGRLS